MEVTGQRWRAGFVCWALFTLTVSTVLVSCEEQEEGVNKTLKCYQCNSWSDEGCSNLKKNGTHDDLYLRECTDDYEGHQPFCRKTVQAIKGHTARVIRSCGWMRHPEDCYHTDDDHHIEHVCQCYTDACNQASRRRDATVLVVAAFVACKMLVC